MRHVEDYRSERGDTIIEAVLALAIFAMVTVSMFAIMQRGASGAYDSLERNQVRMLLNEQTELLNFIRDEYTNSKGLGVTPLPGTPAALWVAIRDTVTATTIPSADLCTSGASHQFYIERNATNVYELKTSLIAATGLPSPGKGLWVQKVDPTAPGIKRNFHDFYVMACWPSTTTNVQTISTVVRLYEP